MGRKLRNNTKKALLEMKALSVTSHVILW